MSVLERCPYKRGHYDDVTFMTPLKVLSVSSVAKTRRTVAFKLDLKLLIHSANTLSVAYNDVHLSNGQITVIK